MLKFLRMQMQRLMPLVQQKLLFGLRAGRSKKQTVLWLSFKVFIFSWRRIQISSIPLPPTPADLPGCLRSFLFLLPPSQFVSEKESSLALPNSEALQAALCSNWQPPPPSCLPKQIRNSGHPFRGLGKGTGGISLAHCFCYIWLFGLFMKTKSKE